MELSLEDLKKIISKSNIVESNEDIIELIYKHYIFPYPKFKKKQNCIRLYPGSKRQLVSIENFWYDKEKNTYLYDYYFPNSEGFCFENGIRKLTDQETEKLKNHGRFSLPMHMSPEL